MAIVPPKELIDSGADNLVNTSEETHYTVPANIRTLVSKATLHNSDTVNSIPITIGIGAIADGTIQFKETLGPNESRDIPNLYGVALSATKTITKQATTTADKVNIYLWGTEIPV